jgi:hypothetical protein
MLAPVGVGAQGMPLREVDWLAVLRAEPSARLGSDCPPGFGGRGPCLAVDLGPEALGGYPLVDNVLYGDLDGDGRDEAVIPVFSGGTAGTIGFLVYRAAEPRPRLAVSQTGYKIGLHIADGRLVVDQPYYFAGDPNCCPTAMVRTPYRLVGDALVPGADAWVSVSDERPLTAAEVVVRGFYNALNFHRLPEAYAFLSPRFQATNPFDAWAGGYLNTESIEVETRPGPTADSVAVKLEAVDRYYPDTRETRRFAGTWRLVPSEAAPLGLLLDQATIGPVP